MGCSIVRLALRRVLLTTLLVWPMFVVVDSSNEINLRKLGDFDELNALLWNAVIRLPDTVVERDLITLTITNLQCTNVQVDDIVLQHVTRQDTTVLQLDLVGLHLKCSSDCQYSALLGILLNGSGRADIYSTNNTASTIVSFTSDGSESTWPPTVNANMESCVSTINVNNMDIQGDFLASILDAFEGLLRDRVENEASKAICDYLSTLRMQDMVDLVQTMLAPYKPMTSTVDPLALEKSLAVPEDTTLIDWLNVKNETEFGKWIHLTMTNAVAYLGATEEDPAAPGSMDMNINMLLRQSKLLQDGALVVNVTDMPFGDNVIYEGHDQLTETSISVNGITIIGLDSLTRFEPLVSIGRYTLQTNLSWRYLAFEFDVTIDMKPSTLEDSFISNPGTTSVVERVKIKLGVDNVDATMSLLLAMDKEALGALELGSLLETENILPCLLSTMIGLEVSTLMVEVAAVQTPTLQGFVSPGSDRVVSGATDAAFSIYSEALLTAVPSFFQTTVRDLFNKNLFERYNSTDCSRVAAGAELDGFVDLRDLLSGGELYGNLGPKLIGQLEKQLEPDVEDADGLPKINSYIRQATQAQSGLEGALQSPTDLFHIVKTDILNASWSSLLETFEARAYHASVQNLDTLTPPLFLLNATEPHLVTNRINIGPVQSRSLVGTMRFLLSLDGESSALNMRNEVEVSIAVPSSALLLDIFAVIDKQAFLRYPLKDVGDYHCWLATIASPSTNLALSRFNMSLSSLSMNISCISCTSPGEIILPEVMQVLNENGIFSTLKLRFEQHVEELALSFWQRFQVLHNESRRLCRHSPEFDENANADEIFWQQTASLSRDAVETIALFGSLAADVAMIVTAKGHLLLPTESSNPLSAQEALVVSQGARLVDWTDLNGTVGAWAEMALDKARVYAGNVTESSESGDQDIGAKTLIRNLLLDDDGMYTVDFNNVTYDAPGVKFELRKVRIDGMDTLTRADTFAPIGPQTLQNDFTFERLELIVDVDVHMKSSNGTSLHEIERLSLSFPVLDVGIRLVVLIAIDKSEVGDLKLGAFLDMSNALPCLLSNAIDPQVSQLMVTIGSFGDSSISGFLSSNLQDTVSSQKTLLFDRFQSDLTAAVPKIFDTTVRETLNDMLRMHRQGARSRYCEVSVPGVPGSSFIDFRDLFLLESESRDLGGNGESPYGDLFRALFGLMNQALIAVDTNETAVNEHLQSWSQKQSNIAGTLAYVGDLFSTNTNVSLAGLRANVELRVMDVVVENVDSLSALKLFQPVEQSGSMLNNTASLGVGPKPLRLTARFLIAISDGADIHIRNEVNASLMMADISLFLRVLLKVSETALTAFPLRDASNAACWLAVVASPDTIGERSAALIRHDVSASDIKFNLSCVSCSSPDFDAFVSSLYSPVLQGGLEQVDRLINSGFLQAVVDRFLVVGSRRCPHSQDYDPDAANSSVFSSSDGDASVLFPSPERDSKAAWFNAANAVLLIVLLSAAVMVRRVVRRRRAEWIKTLSQQETFHLYRVEAKEKERESLLNETTKSLFQSPHIPRHVRLLTPIALLATIGLHFGAHFGVLSTVNVEAQIAGEEVSVDSFMSFSFMDATFQTYQNGGTEMAIFMWVLNGVWPYVKLSALIVLWFMPPKRLSVSRRGTILLWIDVMVRLSIVDMFTMIVAIAAVLVFIGGPDESLVGEGEYFAMKALVLLQGGFYALMIGQRLSRAASRFVLEHHERVVELASHEFDSTQVLKCRDTSICSDDLSVVLASSALVSTEKNESRDEEFHDEESPEPSSLLFAEGKQHEDTRSNIDEVHMDRIVDNIDDDESTTSTVEASSSENDDSHDEINCIGVGSEGEDESKDEDCGSDVNDTTDSTIQISPATADPAQAEYPSAQLQSELSQKAESAWLDNKESQRRRLGPRPIQGGTVGVILAFVTAVVLIIVGCVYAPAISLDTNSIWQLVLESGKNFEEAVTDYSVFRVISTILLQSSFVLDSAHAYAGLGILIAMAIVAGVIYPLVQTISFLRRRCGKKSGRGFALFSAERKSLPACMKSFRLCQHMEAHVIAFVIACWQLSAIAMYTVHYYCYILEQTYKTLEHVGIMESSEAQCFRTQLSLPSTILILVVGLLVLLSSFLIQLAAQYRRNLQRATKLTEEEVWI